MQQDPSDTLSVGERLVEAIASATITTIDDVVAVMRHLDTVLPHDDGLKWFNWLYLRVTEAVRDHPPAAGWEDPVWLGRLDVVFAQLYFEAIRAWHRLPGEVARAWVPLFTARHRRGVARLQFALAGMNAHINHDLPIAVVQTGEPQGLTPRRGSPQHRDYEYVNTILEAVEQDVKQDLVTGIVGVVDEHLGQLDDVMAMWSVRKARETAWSNAEILWHVRAHPVVRDAFLLNLDRLVGLSSRGLVMPIG